MQKIKQCPQCGGEMKNIPDSLAEACMKCGYVEVMGSPAASIQQWAKDLYEADKKPETGTP